MRVGMRPVGRGPSAAMRLRPTDPGPERNPAFQPVRSVLDPRPAAPELASGRALG